MSIELDPSHRLALQILLSLASEQNQVNISTETDSVNKRISALLREMNLSFSLESMDSSVDEKKEDLFKQLHHLNENLFELRAQKTALNKLLPSKID